VKLRRLPSFALLALATCAGKAPSGAVTPPRATSAAAVERAPPAHAGITRVINDNRADIKKCYQQALLEDNTLTHGTMTVTVAIETSGRVKNVEIQGPPQFQSLEPCIKERIGLWSFPQAPEEYGTQFVYVFQGKIGPLERRPTDE
jgi:hypothetical protein